MVKYKQMIENSERGITVSKTLGWAILASFSSMVWWGGSTISELTVSQDQLAVELLKIEERTSERVEQNASSINQLEGRIRSEENISNRLTANIEDLRRSINLIQQSQEETNKLLRDFIAR